MTRQKVLFRVDGNSEIGMGHLVRSLALAQMLQPFFEIVFISKFAPKSFVENLDTLGFLTINISDEELFFELLINDEAIVLIDGYHFSSEYQARIKSFNKKLVCIDDLHDKHFYADLIINHTVGLDKSKYRSEIDTQYAIGIQYALLRPLFLSKAKDYNFISNIKTLFICFGGSDYNNYTKTSIEVALKFSHFDRIIVVTGASYLFLDSISELVGSSSNIEHFHNIDEMAIVEKMLESDVTIIPSSGILLEVLALNRIAISGYYVDNQKYVYENYKNKGLFFDAKNFSKNDLEDAIKLSIVAKQPLKLIDGRSNIRLRNLFLGLKMSNLKVRLASSEDLMLTYNWAIDKRLRAFSFNTHDISFDEHKQWFESRICDSKCFFYIVEYNNEPAGFIRFDLKNQEAVISYLIDTLFQGKGLGLQALVKGMIALEVDNQLRGHTILKYVGYVMPSNIASIKIFENLKFNKYIEDKSIRFEL